MRWSRRLRCQQRRNAGGKRPQFATVPGSGAEQPGTGHLAVPQMPAVQLAGIGSKKTKIGCQETVLWVGGIRLGERFLAPRGPVNPAIAPPSYSCKTRQAVDLFPYENFSGSHQTFGC